MLTEVQEHLFSRPENDHHVLSAWARFLREGRTQENGAVILRKVIDDSWQRSQDAGVDVYQSHAPLAATSDSLTRLRTQWQDLVETSTPIMESTRTLLADTGMVMVLTDPHGVILTTEGDRAVAQRAENLRLIPGANWSETACGTNAIGTSIKIGLPVQIHSAEHYCDQVKHWTCAAMVVRDPLDRRILGVLDISGLSDSYSRHTLSLAISTAARIEHKLARREMELRCRLMESCLERSENTDHDGIVLFDRHGRFIKANGKAMEMLETLRHELGPAAELSKIGLRLDHRGNPTNLPDWVDAELWSPIHVDGQRVGAMLTLPALCQRSLGSYRAQPAPPAQLFRGVIGNAKSLREANARAWQLAKSRAPVLLNGETGVGKELFARGIHDAGSGEHTPFVALNCGGLSRELLSSELFGHVEGSFTGARRGGLPGKIEAADGGTLFLDEIGEIPLDMQPHFLRVLELGEIYRIGDTTPRKVNFRLVAATHRDLRRAVQEGQFRMDLYYRIAVTSVLIPPLRERVGDIDLLLTHYLETLSQQYGFTGRSLSTSARQMLRAYTWPGNIRELRNVIEGMLLTARSPIMTQADIPADICQSLDHSVGHSAGYSLPSASNPTHAMSQTANPNTHQIGSLADTSARRETSMSGLNQAEKQALRGALLQCGGNVSHAARQLGIAKSTIYLKIKRFGLEGLVGDLRGQD